MAENPTAIVVSHDVTAQRFEAVIGPHTAVCEYERAGGPIIFTHTFVPPELRGQGIAEKLVRAGLDYARRERRKVVPSCSYVAAFIARHREYAALLAE